MYVCVCACCTGVRVHVSVVHREGRCCEAALLNGRQQHRLPALVATVKHTSSRQVAPHTSVATKHPDAMQSPLHSPWSTDVRMIGRPSVTCGNATTRVVR